MELISIEVPVSQRGHTRVELILIERILTSRIELWLVICSGGGGGRV